MKTIKKRAFTLIELLVALVLLTLLIVGFFSIDTFARYQIISSDRRVRLQNDASLVLDHINQHFKNAIGANVPGLQAVQGPAGGTTVAIFGRNDTNEDGRIDAGDLWFVYYFDSNSHEVRFVDDLAAAGAIPAGGEVLSSKVVNLNFEDYDTTGNLLKVTITAQWDPNNRRLSLDNPAITMDSSVFIPSVSID